MARLVTLVTFPTFSTARNHHLLADLDDSFPSGEVLRGRVPCGVVKMHRTVGCGLEHSQRRSVPKSPQRKEKRFTRLLAYKLQGTKALKRMEMHSIPPLGKRRETLINRCSLLYLRVLLGNGRLSEDKPQVPQYVRDASHSMSLSAIRQRTKNTEIGCNFLLTSGSLLLTVEPLGLQSIGRLFCLQWERICLQLNCKQKRLNYKRRASPYKSSPNLLGNHQVTATRTKPIAPMI